MRTVTRTRLLAALDADPRAALLLSPAGYGKSTLLRQLAQQATSAGQHVIALDLREFDNDLDSILEEFLAGVAVIDAALAGTLSAAAAHRPLPPRRLMRALKDLPPMLIVFDHAERLTAESEAWLTGLLGADTPHRLVASSRSMESADVALLVATQQMLVIGPEQLAFDAAEVDQIRADTAVDLSGLDGWPLGVTLTAAGAYGQSAQSLIRALLKALPAALQQALPDLAVYDRWTPFLPQQLGHTVPSDWLGQLIINRLPVLQDGDGVRPHDLLLAVLAEQLRQRPGWQDAYRRAAGVATAAGRPLRGLDLLLSAELTAEAVTQAEQVLTPLFQRSSFLLVRQTLERFPLSAVQASPALHLMYGVTLIETQQVPAGMSELTALAQAPAHRPAALPYLAHGHVVRADLKAAAELVSEAQAHWDAYGPDEQCRLLITRGNIVRAQDDADQALQLHLDAAQLAERHHLERTVGLALLALNVTYLRLNRFDEALRAVRRATDIFERLGMEANLTVPLLNAAVLHATNDEVSTAHSLLGRALEIAQAQQARTLTNIHFVLGGLRMKENLLDDAATHFMNAVVAAQVSSRPDFEFMSEAMLSETLRGQHQHLDADRHLTLAENLMDLHPQLAGNRVLAALLDFSRGLRALARGAFQGLRQD